MVIRAAVQGVFLEAEAEPMDLQQLLLHIERENPAIWFIQSREHAYLDPISYEKFEIRESEHGAKPASILADIATCDECRREIFDPQNRRSCYPFTNCSHCGPRFSIIEGPYPTIARTSIEVFEMCPECAKEYHNRLTGNFMPSRMRLLNRGQNWNCGRNTALAVGGDESLRHPAVAIRDGLIVAVKGLGGFQLMVDASNEWAVRRLGHRRRREGRSRRCFTVASDPRSRVLR